MERDSQTEQATGLIARAGAVVVHVAERLDDSCGGPARTVPALAHAVQSFGYESIILSGAGPADSNESIERLNIRWIRVPFVGPVRCWYTPHLRGELRQLCGQTSSVVIHTHNIWTYPFVASSAFAVSRRIPHVASIRGATSPWALRNHRYRKLAAILLYQRAMLRRASCIHVTGCDERTAVTRIVPDTVSVVIPNGIDAGELQALPSQAVARRVLGLPPSDIKILLFLSRLHPVKGLDLLIDAFSTIAHEFPDWQLVLAGPSHDDRYVDRVRDLARRRGVAGRCHFVGPVYGSERTAAFAAADAFVLPSHSENFGMVVGEALAVGLPVVTTTATPWSEIESSQVGRWVRPVLVDLCDGLRDTLSTMIRKPDVSSRARTLASRYSWEEMGKQMSMVYDGLLSPKRIR